MQSKRVLLHSRVNWSLKHFQHLGFQHLRFEFEFECPETFFRRSFSSKQVSVAQPAQEGDDKLERENFFFFNLLMTINESMTKGLHYSLSPKHRLKVNAE
jgi:hypothetical protein